jgi:hypothetical protein
VADPFWPTTDLEMRTFEFVANAALAEVGYGAYRLWIEHGHVFAEPSGAIHEPMVAKAAELGWTAAEKVQLIDGAVE